ncbi:helix-turn-helix domain-containing protein [Fulvivirgaceae bacterium BMA10]|uniref:Helix-turn-helix domain-containing protein n=1 Tax=Splendidivirga corallicola TaxID=3051826 RepID=A0ABT8KXN4_9BACT|nr:helix-turn-helix domain-containing protein [Fulvivirgaceae bacterium BMA10]
MYYKIIPPPAILRDHVKAFWILEGNKDSDKLSFYRLMADSCPEMVFQYKSHFYNCINDKTLERGPLSLVQGPTKHFKDLTVKGEFGIIGVKFYPYISRLFFKTSAHALTNLSVDIQTLLGNEGKCLEELVMLQRTTEERIRVISNFLTKKLRNVDTSNRSIQYSVRQVMECHGNVNIEKLARNTGMSKRHLERKFIEIVGPGPKLFARIVRFQRSIRQYQQLIDKNLTSIAYHCGYADQSHFIREFKAFSGMSPKQYFRITDEVADTFVKSSG